MQTIAHKHVFDQLRTLIGQPVTEDPLAQTKAQLDRLLHFRIRRALEPASGWWWPDYLRTELRRYRADYASGTTYSAPTTTTAAEVFYPPARKYYQALRSTTGNAPATLTGGSYVVNAAYWAECAAAYSGSDWAASTAYSVGDVRRNPETDRYYSCHTAHTSGATFDSTKWGILTPFVPSISLTQTGQTEIGTVRMVSPDDPRTSPRPRRLSYALTYEGIVVQGDYPVDVYVQFAARPPTLFGSTISLSSAYAVGQTVYYSSTTAGYEGDFYTCAATASAGQTPETHASKWTRQEMPAWLAAYAASAAAADWLRLNGKPEAAALQEGFATDLLCHESRQVAAVQGQGLKWRA